MVGDPGYRIWGAGFGTWTRTHAHAHTCTQLSLKSYPPLLEHSQGAGVPGAVPSWGVLRHTDFHKRGSGRGRGQRRS